MQTLVKQLIDEDETPIPEKDQRWHAVEDVTGDEAMLCTGEFTGFGSGSGKYASKIVERGGITCDRCLQRIKAIKAIKL